MDRCVTGLPTKDETVKTTLNSLNMIITWRNEVFCFENSMFNAFFDYFAKKERTLLLGNRQFINSVQPSLKSHLFWVTLYMDLMLLVVFAFLQYILVYVHDLAVQYW